ncbi:MAG: sugar phosphate isomerase/epimerase family protein, partial [Chloroflexota bacterium]
MSGLVPGDWLTINGQVAESVRDHGFDVVQLRVNDPSQATDKRVQGIRSTLREAGLAVGQTVGNYGGGLVSPDPDERAATIKYVKRMVNMTRRIGSPNTYLRPGSMNPNGAWLPHPENRSDKVFDRLVDSTRQIASVAENEGVKLALEGGVVCPVYSPERTREFVDAVGSKALGFNMDPVNYVASLDDAYDTTGLLNRLYDQLGHVIVGAHAKDFQVNEQLLPCFREEIIGSGLMDHETFLKRMQESCPSGHVLIDHLPNEKIPAARDGLNAA